MWQVVRTLRELDYPYMLMPDHVPTVDGADPLNTGFGYCFGYIAGLLQALDATSPPAPAPTEGLAA
jgi:mannonate dehydratase